VEDLVREKDEVIESLNEQVHDRDERIQGLLADLQQSDAATTTQNEMIRTLKEQIEQVNNSYESEKNYLLQQSQAEIQTMKQQLNRLKDRNLQLETLLEKSNAKTAAMEQKMKRMEERPSMKE
jgi:chromosome segregation ATPase